MRLEIASDPLEEMVARRAFGHLHAVVEAGQAHATLHHFVECLQVFVQQVASSTVAVNDHGGGVTEHARVLRVAIVGDDDGLQPDLCRIQMLCQQLAARNVLV